MPFNEFDGSRQWLQQPTREVYPDTAMRWISSVLSLRYLYTF
jgi:hypothetical protein